MPTDQAEIVGEDMAVKFVAELSAQCTATSATYKATENGARNSSESYSEWASESANSGSELAACQCSTDATCCTADRADGSCNFHGLVERGDFG